MKIPALGTPQMNRLTPQRSERAQDATPPEEIEEASPAERAERVEGQPQRSSDQLKAWRKEYESALTLDPKFTKLRKDALVEGGPEMLYRMYPLLFQQDLQGPYQALARLLPEPGPQITLVGDGHVGNLGTLKDGQEVVWTINDYDQVGKGPVEHDLCRAAASLVLLCQRRGFSKKTAEEALEAFTSRYCKGIEKADKTQTLGISKDEAHDPVHDLLKRAEKRTQEDLLSKWTKDNKFDYSEGDLHRLSDEQQERLESLLTTLPKNVKVLDRCCRWDAGGSSMGLERYYILALKDGQTTPTLVELKQVLPCALESSDPSPKKADADLLRDGFKKLRAPKDQWQKVLQSDDGIYLQRERQHVRMALKDEDYGEEDLNKLAHQMGKILAQAHVNAGAQNKVGKWIDGQEETLSENLHTFATAYAAQVHQDFQELFRA